MPLYEVMASFPGCGIMCPTFNFLRTHMNSYDFTLTIVATSYGEPNLLIKFESFVFIYSASVRNNGSQAQ